MIYLLEFTFQSGWHFGGMLVLICVSYSFLASMVEKICDTRIKYFEHKDKEREALQERLKGARMGRLGPLTDEPCPNNQHSK